MTLLQYVIFQSLDERRLLTPAAVTALILATAYNIMYAAAPRDKVGVEIELLGMQYDLIYDVGAHKGEDSEFYLLKGFRVIAIEAVPELCEDIRSRLQLYLQSGQLTLISRRLRSRFEGWQNCEGLE